MKLLSIMIRRPAFHKGLATNHSPQATRQRAAIADHRSTTAPVINFCVEWEEAPKNTHGYSLQPEEVGKCPRRSWTQDRKGCRQRREWEKEPKKHTAIAFYQISSGRPGEGMPATAHPRLARFPHPSFRRMLHVAQSTPRVHHDRPMLGRKIL